MSKISLQQREKRTAYMRKWRASHPENKEYQRDYTARYLTPERREAATQRAKTWYTENTERAILSASRHHLQSKFGLEIEDYLDMLESQNGLCAICKKVCGTGNKLSVDHDHATGEVRGLLCRKCNSGIGMLGDDIERLRSALDYLTSFYK